ncbi:PREDICTED: uncharacterized protein LOC104766393 [Camelina sativa]|uniref:Uncharacterized protein LOC104766393 n=1 Tax=Camelina sativa TaxID=90675 RepID=A0ABM0XNL4_CAMSA|nr:PREDICTED: uncharacterized protein LOC104766393 [Camelina sativa]XP_010488573.1 PREDICTED: uncharacterized protein LOC104766393 [Camelina sativa]
MPEGKLRSGVYRSFIMCDDPRDVVDCGAIKKQSKSRGRCDRPSNAKERSEMAVVAPSRKSTEDVPSHSSMQLLRVSKGIQKLNVAIDSWSKGFSFEAASRPEDIAKDLLRGALDLEESLAMLSSIQEDDIKQKPSVCKDGRRDLRFQRSMSDRFGERIEKRTMVQENVASKDCYEELRKVIRESFLRQNLVSQTKGTKTRVVRSDHFASSSGAASSSTSSSQSSMVSGSTKSSASSDVPRRAPSLIARLMGLDVSSTQEQSKSVLDHIDKADIVKLSLERQEQKMKMNKKESLETVRCNSTREAVLQTLPEENPSTIVLIRPMRVVVQPEMEEKPGNKRVVVPRKPRMQGEVHPRMINNQRKDHQLAKGSNNKMKLPLSVMTKKEKEPKEMVRKLEQNEGKVIKPMSPSDAKAVTKDRKPMEGGNKTNKKLVVKKEDIAVGKDRNRPLKPPSNTATQKKSNNSSDLSRNKSGRSSRLRSSSSSGEQKSSSRVKKSGEANRPNAKKKLRKQDNELGTENNSCSSQDTRGSPNQLSTEETTSSEFHNQGHCDNGEVSSCAPTVQRSHEPETSQISLKTFLSSSSDFISYAEDLFDINTNTKESAFRNRVSIVTTDQRLALDFAKEVARRRSLLLAKPMCPQRGSVDIDELLREVCDEFESLRSYRDTFSEQNSFVKESIHMVLENDLKDKKTEMTSGVWDLCWRSEFQIDETYQAVVDLEKLILSGLIQEIIT